MLMLMLLNMDLCVDLLVNFHQGMRAPGATGAA